MKLLVTGGAGYIGSHCVLRLLQEGHEVVLLDNFCEGARGSVHTLQELKCPGHIAGVVEGDLLRLDDLQRTFGQHTFDAVLHFAALLGVRRSMANPGPYYRVNVAGTLNLLEAMCQFGVKDIVFSSTCAIYGEAQRIPVDEQHPVQPISPYGHSKQMVETVLQDFDRAHGLRYVSLRYFNVIGASASGCLGDRRRTAILLLPLLLDVATGRAPVFHIFGGDYPTRDGTCIRDYIAVDDLIGAHLRALDFLRKEKRSEVFNLGSEQGHSVREVLTTCERVVGKRIPTVVEGRCAGDPAQLMASYQKARELLGWEPRQSLEEAIRLAWSWEQRK